VLSRAPVVPHRVKQVGALKKTLWWQKREGGGEGPRLARANRQLTRNHNRPDRAMTHMTHMTHDFQTLRFRDGPGNETARAIERCAQGGYLD